NVTQGHVQQQTDAGRQRLEEPDVGNRTGQFNMTHAVTANLGQGDFHTTFLADDTAMLQTLVFTAQTLIVLHRAKDLGTEQTVALWLESTIVDGLGLLHFAKGPRPDHLRRRQPDANRVKFI